MSANPRHPSIKVCGLTRAEDVDAAADAGADALGVVHHRPSARHVEIDAAGELLGRRPPGVLGVLVLVDSPPDCAAAWALATGADCVQLCGAEAAQDFARFPLPILRRLPVGEEAEAELEAWSRVATWFVLDHPSGPGGSGRSVDSALARELSRRAPCLLAGGLDGANVAAGLGATDCMGADASSRLESAPGRKDPRRVRAFVRAARAALEARR